MKPGLEIPDLKHVGPVHDRLYYQGNCRVCRIAIYGRQLVEKDICGDDHCVVERMRKNPCKFKRLRNRKTP